VETYSTKGVKVESTKLALFLKPDNFMKITVLEDRLKPLTALHFKHDKDAIKDWRTAKEKKNTHQTAKRQRTDSGAAIPPHFTSPPPPPPHTHALHA
jgi:hypothetical protein